MMHAWTTSWGVSTRLVGGVIMTHSDDDGLVLPPRIAPKHVVIIPIYRDDSEKAAVLEYCDKLAAELKTQRFHERLLQVDVDKRDMRGGDKTWQHIKKGVPIRLEIGPRDMANGAVFLGRRDRSPKDKAGVPRDQFVKTVVPLLEEIQSALYERALKNREAATQKLDSWAQVEEYFQGEKSGFALCHWAEDPAVGQKLASLKVSIRCIPSDGPEEAGKCIVTGKPSSKRAVLAKAY